MLFKNKQYFILKEASSIYDTVSLKRKRQEYLEAFVVGAVVTIYFYVCSTLPPRAMYV